METPRWISDFSQLLKLLEKDSQRVHEFRRSFEAGKKQKQVYPQLENIYNQCKDHLDDLDMFFNEKQFTVTLGLKSIILKSSSDLLKDRLVQLFSNWDPSLWTPVEDSQRSMISAKKMKQIMEHLSTMSDYRLSQTLSRLPQDQLSQLTVPDEMFSNPKTKLMAQQLADRIKNI